MSILEKLQNISIILQTFYSVFAMHLFEKKKNSHKKLDSITTTEALDELLT
jgi:hypothetical protein